MKTETLLLILGGIIVLSVMSKPDAAPAPQAAVAVQKKKKKKKRGFGKILGKVAKVAGGFIPGGGAVTGLLSDQTAYRAAYTGSGALAGSAAKIGGGAEP